MRRKSGKSTLIAHFPANTAVRERGLCGAALGSDFIPPGASCSMQSYSIGMAWSLPREQGDR